MAKATFGGGCFWCTEAVFQKLNGVRSVTSGYAGGESTDPTYEQICRGDSGHAEVIQIEFDETVIPYEMLLEVFFHTHDPTTLNRQGADSGTQYRSVIFTHDSEQSEAAIKKLEEISQRGLWSNKIVTEITPLEAFYPAEEYHQNYFNNNPTQGYCLFAIPPKLQKLREKFPELLSNGD